MTRDLARYLEEIGDLKKPLSHARLTNLSDLNAEDLKVFQAAWSNMEVRRRRQVIGQLVELAEDNFELNFDSVFRFCLRDADSLVRARAIEGLAECEDYSLVDPFIALLTSDSVVAVRAAAASALGKFTLLAEFQKLRPQYSAKVETALLSVLENREEKVEVRRRALESLSPLSLPRIKEVIREAYQSDEPKIKVSALYAMGRNCDPLWLPYLLKELSNPEAEMRYGAAIACGELGEEKAVPWIATLLYDSDVQVQLAAVESLGEIGGSEARRALQGCLRDSPPFLRQAVIEALEEIEGGEDDFSVLEGP